LAEHKDALSGRSNGSGRVILSPLDVILSPLDVILCPLDVILYPSIVILSEAKDLSISLNVNSAKNPGIGGDG
jgi:hypothetical protein